MKPCRHLALVALLAPATAVGHHGVATLGAAGIEGPGAPVETSSSRTLPAGESPAYLELDSYNTCGFADVSLMAVYSVIPTVSALF